jgi:hypothetical protein
VSAYSRRNESGAGAVGSVVGRVDTRVERVTNTELGWELLEAADGIGQLWRVPITVQPVVEGEFELQLSHLGHV